MIQDPAVFRRMSKGMMQLSTHAHLISTLFELYDAGATDEQIKSISMVMDRFAQQTERFHHEFTQEITKCTGN